MIRREIVVPNKLIEELEDSFCQGPMLDERGLRVLNEEQVARLNKMAIKIWPDEHPPPHFHVKFAGEDASFSIADCSRLSDGKGLKKFDHNIKDWWRKNKCSLIAVWNDTRPNDCQVGRILVPPECEPQTNP